MPALYDEIDRLRADRDAMLRKADLLWEGIASLSAALATVRAERDDLRAQVTALRTLRELDIQWLHGLARFADAVEGRP